MRKFLISIAVLLLSINLSFAADYKIGDFGVKADGITLNTRAVQRAIDAVAERGGGRLIFTPGRYLIGTIYVKSNVTLHLERGATLLGSTNAFDYQMDKVCAWMSMIYAVRQENVAITGDGTIDGQGFKTANSMLKYIQKGIVQGDSPLDRPREWLRPTLIYFRECKNVTIKDASLKDPASWTQIYDQCRNLLIDGIKVDACAYWNNDGIDVVDCIDVVVKNCYVNSADDAICFKSHSAYHLCENVVVDNCVARSSASALKFGTVGRGGFKNFKITNLTVYDTYRSAITFATVDGGQIENIHVDGVRSINTGNVIFLRFCKRNVHPKGIKPYFKNVVIENVYAEVPLAKPDAGYGYEGPVEMMPRNISPASIVGIPGHIIEDVTLRNITMVYPGAGNKYFAYRGTTPADLDGIPEMEKSYPEFSQWRELPAWGLYIRHAKDITLENVKFIAEKPGDYRPAIVTDDVKGIELKNVEFIEPESEGKEQVVLYKTTKK